MGWILRHRKSVSRRFDGRGAAGGLRGLFDRFRRDQAGNYLMIVGLAAPVLVGAAAYGTEAGLLQHKQKEMQHAADSAAVSAAVAVSGGANDNGAGQARSVAATYGFVDGQDSTAIQVNSPPSGVLNNNNSGAIEVIINQAEPRLFSSIWGSKPYMIGARAVAIPQGQPCVLALNPTASGAYSQQGNPTATLVNCSVIDDSDSATAMTIGGTAALSTSFVGVVGGISGGGSIQATNGTVTGYRAVPDPYAERSYGTYGGCDQRNYSTHGTETINPGVYCGGIDLKARASVTLNPGTYFLDGGDLSMTGQTSLQGTGVTLVFTSSSGRNYATASISGGASINLTAPTSGSLAGLVVFGDRSMPVGTTFEFTGGDNQSFGGAVYISKGSVEWAGNADLAEKCTQLVADTISMVGDSGLEVDCTGYGTAPIASAGRLIE